MEEKGAVYLLNDLVQVGLVHQSGEPLHGGRGDGVLRLPAPLQAAEGGWAGLVGHGVVGLES